MQKLNLKATAITILNYALKAQGLGKEMRVTEISDDLKVAMVRYRATREKVLKVAVPCETLLPAEKLEHYGPSLS